MNNEVVIDLAKSALVLMDVCKKHHVFLCDGKNTIAQGCIIGAGELLRNAILKLKEDIEK